jgi:hypothetical protein
MIDAATAAEELRRSPKFRAWVPPDIRPKRLDSEKYDYACFMKEQHYEPRELAELWGVSAQTIRNVFQNEPGVLRLPSKPNGKKRKYVLMRVPESVAERVHKRLSAVPQVGA